VDLPAPLSPMTPSLSPSFRFKLTSWSAVTLCIEDFSFVVGRNEGAQGKI